MLFVSHNMGAVSSLCKSGVLLSCGEIKKTGYVDDVITVYNGKNYQVIKDSFSRPRKDCSNRVIITGVNLVPPSSFDSAMKLMFHFKINHRVDKFSVEWFIKDIFGQRIISGLSVFSDRTWFVPTRDSGEIICILDHWRYPGGQYSLSAIISNPGLECMDYIENAAIFIVGDQTPKGTKFVFTPKFGINLPEVRWFADQNTRIECE